MHSENTISMHTKDYLLFLRMIYHTSGDFEAIVVLEICNVLYNTGNFMM